MDQKILAKNRLKVVIIFVAIFFVVLFSSTQQAFSSAEYVEDEINLQDDSSIKNKDGEMFTAVTPTTYSNASNAAIARSRLVTINENGRNVLPAAPDYTAQQIMQLNLFEDVVLTVVQDRIEVNESGSYTWIGHVDGDDFSDVILVINGPYLSGHITMPTGSYNITSTTGNIHRIAELNSAAILSGADDSVKVEPPNDDTIALAPEASDDGSVIDLMIIYTDDAVAAHGIPTLQSWIETYVAYANQAYINSNIAQRISLVHTEEVAYTETGSLDNALDDVQNTNHPELGIVHTRRNTYHADLVMLLVNNDGDGGSCGGLASVPVTVTPAFESSSFGTMEACSFGASVFAHELGHNMGSNHDWYVSASTTPYPYAHGYVDTTNKIRTIMSYNNRCSNLGITCQNIAYFANPSVNFNGVPTGIADTAPSNCSTGTHPVTECQADVQKTFNNTDSNSAIFRSSKITWIGTNANWHDPSNWVINEGPPSGTTPTNRVPRSIDNVLIPSAPTGGNFPTISANADVRDVTIETGATLNMTAGTLNVYGNWEDQGTGIFNATGGSVVFKGSLEQTIASNSTLLHSRNALAPSGFNNVQIGDGGSTVVKLNTNIDINGNLVINAGARLEAGSNTIRIAGNWTENAPVNFVEGTSSVIFDGTNQVINKVTTLAVFNEDFSDSDGVPCCGTSSMPSGWTNENTAWFFGESGAETGRAHGTANGWLHTSAMYLSAGINYSIGFDFVVGTGSSLNVRYGTIASSGAMTGVIGSKNTTGPANFNFTVPTTGLYYIGFQNIYGSGWSNIDNLVVTAMSNITFNNLTVSSGTTAPASNVQVKGNLTTNSTGTLNLAQNEATVEGLVTNNGTLQQTRNVSDGSGGTTYDFLILKNAALNTTKYYGVQITPDNGQALGSTAVKVKGNQDCTSNAADPLARRCFDITPNSAQSATIKYWLTDGERNGQTQNALKVWDYNNSAWVQVGNTASYGTGCGVDSTCWVQYTGIGTFSPMVVGSGAAPTGTPGGAVCSAPSPASNLAAVRSGNNVNLSWTAGAGAESYDVYRKANDPYFTTGGTLIANVAGTTYSDTAVPLGNPAMNYSYAVVAKKGCGAASAQVGHVGEFDFGITPGSGGGPQTYTYNDEPAGGIPINSQTCGGALITRTFNVGDTFNVTDLNVGFNATHTYRGDIRVTLQSPVGTIKQIITENGGDGNDNYDILLDGDSGGLLNNGIPDNVATPFYDRAVMQSLLDDYDGQAANGTWTLEICDIFAGDEGTYHQSRLVFNTP